MVSSTWEALDPNDVPNLHAIVKSHKGSQVPTRRGHISHHLHLCSICPHIIEDQLALHSLAIDAPCNATGQAWVCTSSQTKQKRPCMAYGSHGYPGVGHQSALCPLL